MTDENREETKLPIVTSPGIPEGTTFAINDEDAVEYVAGHAAKITVEFERLRMENADLRNELAEKTDRLNRSNVALATRNTEAQELQLRREALEHAVRFNSARVSAGLWTLPTVDVATKYVDFLKGSTRATSTSSAG